jgi:hypothetical protein
MISYLKNLTKMKNLKYGIGIDISKQKFDACLSVINEQQAVVYISSRSFENNNKGCSDFLQWAEKQCTKENLPIDELRTRLWKNIIEQEYKNGKSFEDFMQYITKKNFPTIIDAATGIQTNYLEEMWKWLIKESYLKREENFEKLASFITPHSIPDSDTRESIWYELIRAEYLRQYDQDSLQPYADAHLTGRRKQKVFKLPKHLILDYPSPAASYQW